MSAQSAELVNIAYLATFHTSSCSPRWHQHRRGAPNDHYQGTDRFSFHTDVEDHPFISFRLPAAIRIEQIVVRLRDVYGKRSLPIAVMARSGAAPWRQLAVLADFLPSQTVTIAADADCIRLVHLGVGEFDLAGVDILVSEGVLHALAQGFSTEDRFMLVHVPFYGLGGQMAVCAGALGALRGSGLRQIMINGVTEGLLAYPPPYVETPERRALLQDNLSRSAANGVLGAGPVAPKTRNIAMWTEDGLAAGQERPVVLVSRDVKMQAVGSEDGAAILRRHYAPMRVAPAVLERVAAIEERCGLQSESYGRALALHLRHGNGERYWSSRTGQWGVKPAALDRTCAALREGMEGIAPELILLASDQPDAAAILQAKFPDIRIIGISDLLQPRGSGCSHNASTFSPGLPRRQVTRAENDLQALAEIVMLGRCRWIGGGKSFFFDAALGLAPRAQERVFSIPNGDRYILLDPAASPLADTPHAEGGLLVAELRARRILTDGLFLTELAADGARRLRLSYFDIVLAEGDDTAALVAALDQQGAMDVLENARWYVHEADG